MFEIKNANNNKIYGHEFETPENPTSGVKITDSEVISQNTMKKCSSLSEVLILQIKIKQVKEILLFDDCAECLQEQCRDLAQYSEKMTGRKIECLPLVTTRDNKSFLYVTQLLPPEVVDIYGPQPSSENRNCHGAALVAAGIHSRLEHFFTPFSLPGIYAKVQKVAFGNLACGDLVYLERGLPNTTKENCEYGLHSFVYLNKNICLSMNGQGKTLELYPLKIVLNQYGYPDETLDAQINNQVIQNIRTNIIILRKKIKINNDIEG